MGELKKAFIKQEKLISPKDKKSSLNNILKDQRVLFVLFGVLLILLQWSGLLKVSQMRAIGTTVVYSVAALGFCNLLGFSGLASLGTAGFMGLGSYVAFYFLTKLQVPFLATMAAVVIVAVVLGIVIGFISLRIQGIFLAIITLGLSEILVNVFIAFPEWTNGVAGASLPYPSLFFGLIKSDREMIFYVCTVVLVVLMMLTYNLMNSPTGRAMLAMKNSTSAAQAFGISIIKYRLFAFVLSTAYAAIAGMLYISYFGYSNPSSWGLALSLNILGAIIIGGMRSIWGALAGVFILYGIQMLVLQNIPFFVDNPTFITLFSGVLIIVIVMFLPGGLPELVRIIKGKITKSRKLAKERRYGEA